MPKHKKRETEAPGQLDDGSFDLGDIPSPADLDDPESALEAAAHDSSPATEELMRERDDAIAARQRALADFANFQRRAADNEQRAERDGVKTVLRSLLPVLDHIDIALGQHADGMTLEQLLDGVRMMRDEIGKVMEGHHLRPIAPEPGDEFNPSEHQAVMREGTDEQPPDTIVKVLQVGYAFDEAVLRPATVTVAAPNGPPEDDAPAHAAGDEE